MSYYAVAKQELLALYRRGVIYPLLMLHRRYTHMICNIQRINISEICSVIFHISSCVFDSNIMV